MKKLIVLLVAVCFTQTSCKTLSALGIEPSAIETAMALKEVLNSSTFRAIKTLKNLNDDGVDGILPEQLKPVLGALRQAGLGGEVDKIAGQIQNVSAITLDESQGIISDAIGELKFKDAVSVVLGGEDAATAILRQAMYSTVKKRYSQRLDQQLDKTEAKQYWPMAAGAYNLFSKDKVDNSLSDFLAERAVDGLFLTMGKEEKKVRNNYKDLGKSVVTKVFDYYGSKKKTQS